LLLVTAATNISVRFCYSILEILAGDVCFVNLFRSDLPVVPTESDVLLNVGNITTKSGSLKNSMQKCGKILSPPWFQHCGASDALLISFPSPPLPHKPNQGSACVVSSLTGCEQSPATKRFSVHSHTETTQSSTCMSMARFHDFCCKQNLLVRLLWGGGENNGHAPTGFWRWGRAPWSQHFGDYVQCDFVTKLRRTNKYEPIRTRTERF